MHFFIVFVVFICFYLRLRGVSIFMNTFRGGDNNVNSFSKKNRTNKHTIVLSFSKLNKVFIRGSEEVGWEQEGERGMRYQAEKYCSDLMSCLLQFIFHYDPKLVEADGRGLCGFWWKGNFQEEGEMWVGINRWWFILFFFSRSSWVGKRVKTGLIKRERYIERTIDTIYCTLYIEQLNNARK